MKKNTNNYLFSLNPILLIIVVGLIVYLILTAKRKDDKKEKKGSSNNSKSPKNKSIKTKKLKPFFKTQKR